MKNESARPRGCSQEGRATRSKPAEDQKSTARRKRNPAAGPESRAGSPAPTPRGAVANEHSGPRGHLAAAFAELSASGIVARHEWACCQSCGCRGMEAERGRLLAAGRPVRGYVFYNEQTAASAARNGEVWLSYGDFKGDDGSLEIAREIVTTLERFGLSPEWEGTIERKILVRVGGYFMDDAGSPPERVNP